MKHTINSNEYRVKPGSKVKLAKWPTLVEPHYRKGYVLKV